MEADKMGGVKPFPGNMGKSDDIDDMQEESEFKTDLIFGSRL